MADRPVVVVPPEPAPSPSSADVEAARAAASANAAAEAAAAATAMAQVEAARATDRAASDVASYEERMSTWEAQVADLSRAVEEDRSSRATLASRFEALENNLSPSLSSIQERLPPPPPPPPPNPATDPPADAPPAPEPSPPAKRKAHRWI